jgi:phosphotransferase system enzyme I (PtsI)
MSRTREKILHAEIASPGLARGVIHRLATGARHAPLGKTGTPAEENQVLADAVAGAMEDLSALAATAGKRVADLLAGQIAELTDPTLVGPAFEAIAGGEPAATAFYDAMELRIADCRAAGQARQRARPEDLVDLRDRVLRRLAGGDAAECRAVPENAIVVAEELTPSRFLEIDWQRARAAVSLAGSPTGHVALLARSRGVPLVIAPYADPAELKAGLEVILDAEAGRLILAPGARTGRDYDDRIAERDRERRQTQRWLDEPAVTADGTRVRLYLNVDDPAVLEGVDPAHCEGIGLARSEFLFAEEGGLPDEERQYRVYRALLSWAGGLPVTVRTLDAGGDKPLAGLTPEGEANPLLGLRGLRLSLVRPEVFRVQLRALARAAAHGPLKAMVPMVTLAEEFDLAQALLAEEIAALKQAGIVAALPEFGMMVETPAAALNIAEFDADFYSIGTNDLVQFVMAAGRDCAGVAKLLNPLSPAVLELIARVCARGRVLGREVSVCGEAASRPDCIPALLNAGVRALSVPPAALAEVKKSIFLARGGA